MKSMGLFFNPFKGYSAVPLLILGIIGMLAGSLLAYFFNARFDGAIDFHIVPQGIQAWWVPFLDNLLAVLSLCLVFYIGAKVLDNKTKGIDILVTCLVARLPLYVLPLTNFNGMMEDPNALYNVLEETEGNFELMTYLPVILGIFISLFFLIWMIALLFNGFKTAIQAQQERLVGGFVLCLIFSEGLSQVIFYLL